MNKKIFDDGTLVVEQVETKKVEKPVARTMTMKSAKPNKVNSEELIATAFSYGSAGFEVLEYAKEQKCAICGATTAYSNRFVCPKCWMQNKEKIMSALKKANESISVEL